MATTIVSRARRVPATLYKVTTKYATHGGKLTNLNHKLAPEQLGLFSRVI